MPSFDVVSDFDAHEAANAVDQANREVTTRFDFKGTGSKFELDNQLITLTSQSEFQLQQMMDILRQKLAKRGVDIGCLDEQEPEVTGSEARQNVILRRGIDSDLARRLVKTVKGSKIRVQAAIQGDKLRISGKKRDDLQSVIAMLKKLDFEGNGAGTPAVDAVERFQSQAVGQRQVEQHDGSDGCDNRPGVPDVEQTPATLLGQQRIVAGDQTFARIVRVGDLGQIPLVKQRQLQRLIGDQFLHLDAFQRRDPVDAGNRLEILPNPRGGEHAPVAHQCHRSAAETIGHFPYLGSERGRVRRIARKNLD